MMSAAQSNRVVDTIGQFQKILELKNRQLVALKEIACILAEAENETVFVAKVLPIIADAMQVAGEPLLYAGINGSGAIVAGQDRKILEQAFAELKQLHGLAREILPLDLSAVAPGTPLAALGRPGFSAAIFVPVYYGDRDLGFLAIPYRELTVISSDEQVFLKYVSETIGIFLRNVQLDKDYSFAGQEMEQSMNELVAIYAVSMAISADLDVRTILERAIDTMLGQEILNIQAKGGVFLVNETTGRLDMVCYRGIHNALVKEETSIPFGHCLCGIAAETGEIVVSDNCFTDSRHHTNYPGMAAHGHIIVPLKSKDRVIGVIFLYLPAGVQATRNQIKMLKAIASQLAVAVENAKLYEKVKHLSLHDPLTGLANRNLMQIRLDEELSRSRRHPEAIALAMVDIDHFKKVNDTHGHPVGDTVLRVLGGLMREELRQCDVVARFGGEEFTVIMPATNLPQARIALERLRKRVETHEFAVGDGQPPVLITISAGIAVGDSRNSKDSTFLLKMADKALYQAKAAGRNRVVGRENEVDV